MVLEVVAGNLEPGPLSVLIAWSDCYPLTAATVISFSLFDTVACATVDTRPRREYGRVAGLWRIMLRPSQGPVCSLGLIPLRCSSLVSLAAAKDEAS